MIITPLTERGVEAVVKLHQRVLGNTFNARVGSWFLAHLYQQLLAHPQWAMVHVAYDQDQLVGFVSAATDYRLLSQQLMATLSFKQKLTVGVFLLVHPTLWVEFWRQRMFATYIQHHLSQPLQYILTLGVDTNQQGKGVGRALMDAVVGQMQREQPLYLDTKADNQQAIKFYERYGFTIIKRLYGNVLCLLKLPIE